MKAAFFFGFVICIFANAFAIDEKLQAIVNDYIDDFIEKATNGSGGFIDPLPLDEVAKSFEREVGRVKVKGEAKLYDGKIYGLSSLQRKGNAVAIDLDDFLIISTQLTFKKIHAFYRGAMLLNNKGPRITLDAKIGKSKVTMFLTVPAEGGPASLMSFNINKLQDIRVSVWGLGAMGWTASIISTLALNALEQPVAKAASIKIFEYFSKELEKVPFPGSKSE
ncbi:mite allergen Der f 7-like [Stegodyphus dumicola]|uniref:mite allergen Der f 7-like n=1 Tax=Stegodyphus dumicola TaxID=202533 RepID=UPI0015ABAC91|nr:mite allergen Der f 7-like [Stegodyphus dumicola]